MKRFIVTVFCTLLTTTFYAQTQEGDESAINKQIDAMIYSWNHHNYDDLINYTTENTDWVNGVGMWWKGRKESQFAHQEYHNGIFKQSVVTKQSTHVRFLTKDVALAHVYWHFNEFTDPAGKKIDASDCIATVVYRKQNGRWLMESGMNIPVVKEAEQFDPVKRQKK